MNRRGPFLSPPEKVAALATVAALVLMASVALGTPPAHGQTLPPGVLPPPSTPGALNPNVTQANIATTICVPNWTTTIRPPASYTSKLKRQQMTARGLPGPPSSYEEDHLIALSSGGDPTSPLNLWSQPWAGPCGAHQKDRIEVLLHRLTCRGKITLAEAQHELQANWVAAYVARIGPLDCTH